MKKPEAPSPHTLAFTLAQAALALGVCRTTIEKLVRERRVKTFRVGRSIRIARTEIERLMRPAPVVDFKKAAAGDRD